MTSSSSTRSRFELNFRQQLARSGLKNSPLPSLPDSWLLSAIRSFDFSQVSDLPAAPPSFPTLPPLHRVQQRMVDEAKRFNVAACGRQIGKTTLGINRVATAAEAGWPCAWFAPTYKYLDEVWRSVRDVLEPVTVSRSEQQHRLAVHGGGSTQVHEPVVGSGRQTCGAGFCRQAPAKR